MGLKDYFIAGHQKWCGRKKAILRIACSNQKQADSKKGNKKYENKATKSKIEMF